MKIGDKVKVVSNGRTYSTYSEMFKEMGFKENDYCQVPRNGLKAKIFAIAIHPWQKINIYGIQDYSGEQYLIGEKGIELIESCHEKTPE